jgi:hypothetical protein
MNVPRSASVVVTDLLDWVRIRIKVGLMGIGLGIGLGLGLASGLGLRFRLQDKKRNYKTEQDTKDKTNVTTQDTTGKYKPRQGNTRQDEVWQGRQEEA